MVRRAITVLVALLAVTPATARAASYDLSVLETPPPTPAPASFVSDTFDTFTGWTQVAGSSATAQISSGHRLRQSLMSGTASYVNATVPASADYSVAADVVILSRTVTGMSAGVTVRMTSAASNGYMWRLTASTADLYLLSTGGNVNLCSVPETPATGSTHRLELDATGSELVGKMDGTAICDVTDSTVTQAGSPGVRVSASTGPSDGTGFQLDNLDAEQATGQDVVYQGLRDTRTWHWNGTSWDHTDVPHALGAPGNYQNAVLPPNLLLATDSLGGLPVNPGAGNDLQAQVNTYSSGLNYGQFTPPIITVPADQPLTPVVCGSGCVSQVKQVLAGTDTDGTTYIGGGVPLPDSYISDYAAGDHDSQVLVWQPDYTSPCNSAWHGRLYEISGVRPNPSFDPSAPVSPGNARWLANHGGRVVGMDTAPGHYRNWTTSGCHYTQPGHPDSTWQGVSMSTDAIGSLMIGEVDSREDCYLYATEGIVPAHELGIQVHDAHTGHRWPANGGDGTTSTQQTQEGERVFIRPDAVEPAFNNRFADMVWKQLQKYGGILDDKTLSSVGPREEPTANHTAAPECSQLWDGQHTYNVLDAIPWDELQVIADGTDAAPNPTGP